MGRGKEMGRAGEALRFVEEIGETRRTSTRSYVLGAGTSGSCRNFQQGKTQKLPSPY